MRSDPIRTKPPSRQAYSEMALSVASTLASTRPWFVSTATISRGEPRVDLHGGLESAGVPGLSLAKQDVTGRIDHQHIVGTVAIQVCHYGRGMGGGGELTRVRKRAVAVIQQHRHVVVADVADGQVGAARRR